MNKPTVLIIVAVAVVAVMYMHKKGVTVAPQPNSTRGTATTTAPAAPLDTTQQVIGYVGGAYAVAKSTGIVDSVESWFSSPSTSDTGEDYAG